MIQLRASALLAEFSESGLLDGMTGDDVVIERVASADECQPGDLVFVDRPDFVAATVAGGACAIITDRRLAGEYAGSSAVAVLTTRNVKLARAMVTQRYFDRNLRPRNGARIHPRATVHPGASVAATACLGPGVCVGDGATIGENCVLLANAVVEERAVLGDRTVIHPCSVIGFECEIGRDVVIGAGTVIGSEGFGFAQDQQRKSHRIPQLGNVVLGDRVSIGANCCIDRGTYGSTRIGAGTVMDNFCHIAHNVVMGEDCILAATVVIAGSSRIGDRFISSGQTAIIDNLNVADDVVLVHRAGVSNDIKQPGVYAGVPLQTLPDYRRKLASLRKLAEMRGTIKTLEKRLAALEAERD